MALCILRLKWSAWIYQGRYSTNYEVNVVWVHMEKWVIWEKGPRRRMTGNEEKERQINIGSSNLGWGRCRRHGVLLWSWSGSGCAPLCAVKSGRPLLGWRAERSWKAQRWCQGQSCWPAPLHRERGDPLAGRGRCAWSPCRSPCPSPHYPWRGCGLERIISLGDKMVLFNLIGFTF